MPSLESRDYAVTADGESIVLRRRRSDGLRVARAIGLAAICIGIPLFAVFGPFGAVALSPFASLFVVLTTLALADRRANARWIVQPRREVRAGPLVAGYRDAPGTELRVDGRGWPSSVVERVLVVLYPVKNGCVHVVSVLAQQQVIQIERFRDDKPALAMARALATALKLRDETVATVPAPMVTSAGNLIGILGSLVVDLGAFIALPAIIVLPLGDGPNPFPHSLEVGLACVAALLAVDAAAGLVARRAIGPTGPLFVAQLRTHVPSLL